MLVGFLALMLLSAIVSVSLHGIDFYLTPIALRPFRADYSPMKPSGFYSHGLGIAGGSMIIIGVSMYMVRKRTRAMWNLGRLSTWLEVHIFLCLLGPTLVVFHTTFKAGGVAAISLWTMLSVAGSGIVGRFLYTQIPRNLKGAELTAGQIAEEVDRLEGELKSSPLGLQVLRKTDEAFAGVKVASTFGETVQALVTTQRIRHQVNAAVKELIGRSSESTQHAHDLRRAASQRAALIQKSLLLSQVEKLFHYWHVIHVPFTVIMFITLAAHVTVTLLLGYNWVF
jgi:hypothetical protein